MSGNSNIVLGYLNSYFRENTKPLTIFDIDIKNLSMADIEKAFEELSSQGLIKLNDKYIYPSVEGVTYLNSK